VRTLGLILGLLAEATLASGGYIGGTLSFVYGVRVLKRPATPPRDALVPGRLPPDRAPTAPPTAPSTPLAQSSRAKESELHAQPPAHRRTRR
jgi:hypothetical protein